MNIDRAVLAFAGFMTLLSLALGWFVSLREALQVKLETEGWKISRIKTDNGCYEVRATDKEGRRVEASYNPKTFEQVKFELED